MKVYLEVGKRRTFACAVDWPGWCRAGKDPEAALQALVDYGPRYAAVVGGAAAALSLPGDAGELEISETLEGDATTDFGAPGAIPDPDQRDVSEEDLETGIEVLRAAWRAFDSAAEAAQGRTLDPAGPRGGGRALEKIREHVIGADGSYTSAVGGKGPREYDDWPQVQRAFIEALRARARGEVPDVGPRGGRRWPARFAIRRAAWHALDHAWEIEDRARL